MEMNYFRIFTLSLALLVGQFAAADIKTITLASEISLSAFRVPASVNGVASFKKCESCEMQVVSVTRDTRYEFNRNVVTLQEFRRSLAPLTNRERKTVIVMHHLESDVITSISLNL
jgi:hypothetical protein